MNIRCLMHLLLFSGIPTFSCSAQNGPRIRLVATLPLSGAWASWGNELRQGLEIASANTPDIEIEVVDDKCMAREALTNVQKLIADRKAQGIIAGCVEVLDAIGPVTQRAGLPVFALGGMDEALLMRTHILCRSLHYRTSRRGIL